MFLLRKSGKVIQMDMVTYYSFRNGKFTIHSSLGCLKILSLAVVTIITTYPAIAADQPPISVCPGKQLQVFESAKADPIRKGIGTSDPQATLDINGGVKIGNDLSDCKQEKAGTIRWTGEFFEGCNGKEWISLQK